MLAQLQHIFPGATEISSDALLKRMSDKDRKTALHDDLILSLCAYLWGHAPHREEIASIALQALARCNDTNIAVAENLRTYIKDFDANVDAKKSYQRIHAAHRSKQSYYFRTQYQAKDVTRLKAQLTRNKTIVPIAQDASFTCIGSCFASNLGSLIKQRNVDDVIAYRYQDDTDPLNVLMSIIHAPHFKERIKSRKKNVVILTAGFAETGQKDDDVGSGTLSRFLKPESVAHAITQVRKALNEYGSDVRLFTTVSPVPLNGTMSGLSPYEANAISKAIIRLGVEMAQNQIDGIEYYPSYELVTQHSVAIDTVSAGVADGSPFHVSPLVVQFVIDLFMEFYMPWIDFTQAPSNGLLEIITLTPQRASDLDL